MRDIVLALFVFGLLPKSFLQPYIGLLVWSWLGYMNPHRMAYGFAYNFPFVMLVAVVTLAGLFFSKEKKRIPITPVTLIWMMFIFWMTMTTFLFALHPEGALYEWNRMIKIQIMVLVTLMIMGSQHRLRLLVWVIVLSIGFYGVKGGLFTIATAGSYRVWGPEGSFIEGNNEIAFALLITIPLMRFLQLTETNKWIKRGLLAAMVLSGFAVVGSYSRGAFLAAAAMIFLLWFRSRRKIMILIPLSIVVFAVLSFMPDKYFERMNTIQTYEQDDSAMGRINAWTFAYNLAKDRPFSGGGYNAFTKDLFYIYAPIPEDHHDAHSIYFEVLGEHGFVGLGLFLALGLSVFLAGNWVVRKTKKRPDLAWFGNLAAMTQVSFIGYAVGGAFLGLAYFDLPYHLMAIMVLTKVLVAQQLLKDKEYDSLSNTEKDSDPTRRAPI